MSCNFVTDCITCRDDPGGIRHSLNIKTKITPAEEEEISRENAWAFITPKEEGEEVRRGNTTVEQWLKICFLPEDDSKAAEVVRLLMLHCKFPTHLELNVRIDRLLWELNKIPAQTFLDEKVAYSSMLCNVAAEISHYTTEEESGLTDFIPRLYNGAKVFKEGHIYRGPYEPALEEVEFYKMHYNLDGISAEDVAEVRKMMKKCYRHEFKRYIIEEVKFAKGYIHFY